MQCNFALMYFLMWAVEFIPKIRHLVSSLHFYILGFENLEEPVVVAEISFMKHTVKLMRTILFLVDRTQFHVFPCLDQTILGYSRFHSFFISCEFKFIVVLKFVIWCDKYWDKNYFSEASNGKAVVCPCPFLNQIF